MKAKYKTFFRSMVTFLVIIALLIAYQVITLYRGQAEEIAQLESEVKGYSATIENYKAALGQEDSSSSTASFKDGSYSGSAQGFGGLIQVTVTVSGGSIKDITIDSAPGEDKAYLDMAVKIMDDIIDQQSLDVDTISGATYSSNGIKNAVISALQDAI